VQDVLATRLRTIGARQVRGWYVLAIVLAAILILGCGKSEGQRMYEAYGCPQCHGQNRDGTAKGPPLRELRYIWSADDLENYLKNSALVVGRDERLKELSKQYQTTMPSFALEEKSRRMLVEYLMED
jgi:mono/diheme cytochrome c family protein